MFERIVDCAFTQFLRGLEPGGVGVAEGAKLEIALHRKGEMPRVHFHMRVQPLELFRIFESGTPILFEGLCQNFLRVPIFRQSAADAAYSHYAPLSYAVAKTRRAMPKGSDQKAGEPCMSPTTASMAET